MAALRIGRPGRTLVLVVLLQLIAFGTLAALRTVDADEGFYLLAARLVVQGHVPYGDFLYTQMPLLPYVYGAWMSVFGFNWYAARALSALLATVLGTLVYHYVEDTLKSRELALLGVFLFAASAFTLAWNTVVMTYPLSGLLLFGALTVLGRPWQMPSSARVFASGALLGLSIDTRLPVIAAAPIFAFGVARHRRWTDAARTIALWFAGLVVGLLPSLILALGNWEAFAFGNVGFHAMRNAAGSLVGDWTQKAAILAELLNIRSAGGETITFQMPLLIALNAYYLWLVVRRRAELTIAFGVSAVLAVALFLPTPTYSQYFVILIPFLLVNGLYALNAAREDARATWGPSLRTHVRAVLGVFIALYALVVPVVFYRYLSWLAPGLPDVHQVDPRPWSIPAIRSMSAAIDRSSAPGEAVLAWWPGYVFETHAVPISGMENHGWMEMGSGSRPGRPTIASRDSVNALLAQAQVRLVVPGILTPPEQRALALASGYERVDSVAGVDLLHRPDHAR